MIKLSKTENKYFVSFYNTDKLNVLNSKEIEQQLLTLLKNDNSELTLNFLGIKFIDSSGFNVLKNVYKESIDKNTEVKLLNLSDELIELVKLVELDQVFQIN